MTFSDEVKYKTYTRRATIVAGGMMVLSSALVGRMYYLQVVSRDQYELLADENRISLRLLAPERGKILDRYGRPLALNRSDYRINLIPEQADDVRQTLNTLARYIPLTERDYSRILKAVKRQRSFLPVAVAENLDWETFANVNINIPDLPGIQPDVGTTRYYPEKENFAHLVGYVGSVSETDLGQGEDPLLELPGFKIGKNGIERELEHLLRGQAGNSRVEVNALGRVIRELSRQDSQPGTDIRLTIDRDIQNFAAGRLRDQSAAAVVMDIHNGDVLALASTPAFDPNDFNLGISQKKWNELVNDQRKPLINKPVTGQYPPGSTFKMIVALAALEDGVVREEEKIFCNGKYQLGNHTFHCWRRQGHGHMNLVDAIARSCDVYFFDVARRVGIEKIRRMALRFGLGERYGLTVPGEARGLIPSEGWKLATQGVRWQGGDTVNAGIGQGYVLATPLQLAVMTARLANGGRAVVPRLLSGAKDDILAPAEKLGVSPYHLKLVQKGMEDVMNDPRGTAFRSRIRDKNMMIAGKTGTSQVRRISKAERESGIRKNEEKPWIERDHAIFVGYGPLDHPRYAVSVLVEHGGGGASGAAPVARDILEFVMQQDRERKQELGKERRA
ncbi:penicillin-binding protein 2 [Luteithermobacter gelatinilyticus]|uniref:penicillin-binding protein 2 n=1 Tax=Luteithermobacter gelatinilyticus TaxID=2582913 RepID=UPI00110752FF|nr:penicillin-binding protein 2 [Luteithermobacter gelatinilyticus]